MIRIPVNEPDLAGNEQAYVLDAVKSGWISSGPYVARFERQFAAFAGTRRAVTTTSGTAALQLAIAGLGIGPGDEVILPALTIVSTALAVCHAGANPVLVDSEPETGNIDPGQIEEKITARTRAILPVHLYGHPAAMAPIGELARRYRLHVVEDAAEAHGATYHGRRTGSLGTLGCFSLYANKLVTTGEGGIVTTDDDALADRVARLKDLAHSPAKRFVHTNLGYSLRMTNLQAALGVAQMERVHEFMDRKRRMAARYAAALADVEGLHLPANRPEAEAVPWMYAVRVTAEFGCSRDDLMRRLESGGVETRTFFVPMHRQPVFETAGRFAGGRYPVAERLSAEGFYLPSGLTLRPDQIDYVADQVRAIQQQVRGERP